MEEFNALKDAQAVGRALLQKSKDFYGTYSLRAFFHNFISSELLGLLAIQSQEVIYLEFDLT